MAEGTKKVKWIGPDGQSCPDLGAATGGSSLLKSGETYEVPTTLAKSLIASSVFFEDASGGKKEG